MVEVGVRQAWPFLGFCDNRGASSRETRLYLDAFWSIDGEPGTAADTQHWLVSADALNGLTVSDATVENGGTLRLKFAGGGAALSVSAETTSESIGEPWWLTPWQ